MIEVVCDCGQRCQRIADTREFVCRNPRCSNFSVRFRMVKVAPATVRVQSRAAEYAVPITAPHATRPHEVVET
jgi:hypothetical protein